MSSNSPKCSWVEQVTTFALLALSWRRPLSYRNQSTDLRSKSMDWFLYDNGLRHERVKCYRKRVFIVWFVRQIYLLCLFVGVWIKLHFPLKGPVIYLFLLSLFNSLCDLYLSKICGKRDVSLAQILQVDWMLSDKSLVYIRNKRGPRTKPCGPPDLINSQEEIWLLRTALSLRSRR